MLRVYRSLLILCAPSRLLAGGVGPSPFGGAAEQTAGRALPERMLMASTYAEEWRDGTHASTLAALDSFIAEFTSVVANFAHAVRVVNSEGGAAGGVVSEGQGYGLLLAASTLAALPHDHPRRMEVEETAYELYLGWRRMCERTVRNSCQDTHRCGDDGNHECLAGWKFDAGVNTEVGTGSASDGDADAILGMIILALAAESHAGQGAASSVQYSAASEHSAEALEAADATPNWAEHLRQWTYQSCRAFLTYLTTTQAAAAGGASRDPTAAAWGGVTNHYYHGRTSAGSPMRILKLGSCWGGWDCANPSYLAPAHFRAFRDYMRAFAHRFGASAQEGDASAAYWDALLETSYLVLNDAQCPATGLVPNWFVPICTEPGAAAGCAGCNASGTPADQFGAEASRTGWRVSLDVLWYGDESDGEGVDARGEPYGGRAFVRRLATQVAPRLLEGGALDVRAHSGEARSGGACHVRSVLGGAAWAQEAYMLGPTAAVLAVAPEAEAKRQPSQKAQPSVLIVRSAEEVPHARQQAALDLAAKDLAARSIRAASCAPACDYPAAWLALSTATLSGAVPSLGPLLRSLRARAPPASPPPAPRGQAGAIGGSIYGRAPPPPPEHLLVDRMEKNLEDMHRDNQRLEKVPSFEPGRLGDLNDEIMMGNEATGSGTRGGTRKGSKKAPGRSKQLAARPRTLDDDDEDVFGGNGTPPKLQGEAKGKKKGRRAAGASRPKARGAADGEADGFL